MSNPTTSYTFLSGVTVPMTLRKDGRYTARQQTAILADIDARLASNAASLAEYAALYSNVSEPLPEDIILAWDARHDYATELETTRRDVERNLAHVIEGSTAWLAANNID